MKITISTRNPPSRKNLPAWIRRRKGQYYSLNGYVMIWNGFRFVQRSRLIAEKALGRPLTENEVVHHIDGDKENDSNNNLLICNQQYHAELHQRCKELYNSYHLPK